MVLIATGMTSANEKLETKIVELGQKDLRSNTRYPYTYACDYIRETFGVKSRADAARIMSEMSASVDDRHHHKIATAFAEAAIAAGHAG